MKTVDEEAGEVINYKSDIVFHLKILTEIKVI